MKQKIQLLFILSTLIIACSSFGRSLIVSENEKEFKKEDVRGNYQFFGLGYSLYNNNNYENKYQSKGNGVRMSLDINKPVTEKFSYGGGFSLYYNSEDSLAMDIELVSRFFFNRILSGPFLELGAGYIWVGGNTAHNGVIPGTITGDSINIAPFLKGGLGVAIETMPGEKAYVFGIKGYYYFNKEFGKEDINKLIKHNTAVILAYFGFFY